MRAEHRRKWIQEHWVWESASEEKDEGVMSELGGRDIVTEDRREVGEKARMQTKWEMVVELIQTAFQEG